MLKHASFLTLLLLSSWTFADPAILNGANGADCQIPLKPNCYSCKKGINQIDFQPVNENDLNILVVSSEATAICENVDEKVRIPFFNKLDIVTLPYEVKLSNKDLPKVWCRIEDSDNNLYFSKKWKTLLKVEVQGAKYKVTKKVFCQDGILARRMAKR